MILQIFQCDQCGRQQHIAPDQAHVLPGYVVRLPGTRLGPGEKPPMFCSWACVSKWLPDALMGEKPGAIDGNKVTPLTSSPSAQPNSQN